MAERPDERWLPALVVACALLLVAVLLFVFTEANTGAIWLAAGCLLGGVSLLAASQSWRTR